MHRLERWAALTYTRMEARIMGEKGAEAVPTGAPVSGAAAGLSDNSDLGSKIGGLNSLGTRPQSTDVSDLIRKDRMNDLSGAPNAGVYPDGAVPSPGLDAHPISGLNASLQSGVPSPSDLRAPESIAPGEDVRLNTLIANGQVTSPYAGTGGNPKPLSAWEAVAPDPSRDPDA